MESSESLVRNRATASRVGITNRGADSSPSNGPRVERRALVAYGSRFGNTQRIAEALAKGLREVPGVSVDCLFIDEVDPGRLGRYDFLAVGGPTEVMSASGPMKNFLAKLPTVELRGKRGFAFDTRYTAPLSGSAGRYIEKHLERIGVEILRRHRSAYVRGMTKVEREQVGKQAAPDWVRKLDKSAASESASGPLRMDLLDVGAENDFEKIGTELATALTAPRPS
jgi:menaquinone-dependent protoporphyrinogen IX oxidase